MVFNAIKGDFMKKWLLYCATLYALVVIPSLVFGQTPIASTRVNEALKAQLDSDGKWLSILFSDGSSQSTAGGSVTSVSVTTANGVSGSVSNPTTTPAISLVLGAITPSSVNAVVLSGSSLPNLTVTGTASVSGANTGDQTNITGNAATVTTNANLTGHVTSTGNAAVLGSFSSANLAGALSDETGSGAAVFGTAPTIQNVSLTGTFKGVTGYPLIQPITSDRRRFIENSDGIGSSAWAYNTPQQSSAITGTRTSDTIFTRSSGTWTINALVGQYVFSFATGVPATGVWLPITANTTTTLTVSGTLNATGTSVYTSPWSPIAATYAHGQGATAFVGGVFDGESIWLIPLASANLVKVNPATGVMTTYAHGQGATAFIGGVFDGESVWLIPLASANLVKVNPATGAMTTYAHGQGSTAFAGGVFDGGSVWLVPNNSANLVKVNPATGAMTTYAHGQSAEAFAGGVFDGESIWLIPRGSANLVKVNPATGAMTTYAHGQGSLVFSGGVFDGGSVWLIPYNSANLVKVNPATGVMTTYAHGQGATAFYGGIFDGESVWLVPNNSANLVKVNPATGVMTTYAHGQGATAFAGGVFDGGSVWLVPNNSANLVKVNPPRSGRGVTTGNRNFAGNLLVAGTITASMGYKFSDGSSITSGKEPFIQLSDSTNQEPGVTTPVLVTFDTQDAIEGMSHSGGTITAHRAGVYCIIAAGQVGKTQGATDIKYDMWLKKNTTYIANSGVRNTILTASDTKVVVQNTGIRLSAGDTINVYHSIDTTGDGAGLKVYNPAGEPRIPSIILTMYRIGD